MMLFLEIATNIVQLLLCIILPLIWGVAGLNDYLDHGDDYLTMYNKKQHALIVLCLGPVVWIWGLILGIVHIIIWSWEKTFMEYYNKFKKILTKSYFTIFCNWFFHDVLGDKN